MSVEQRLEIPRELLRHSLLIVLVGIRTICHSVSAKQWGVWTTNYLRRFWWFWRSEGTYSQTDKFGIIMIMTTASSSSASRLSNYQFYNCTVIKPGSAKHALHIILRHIQYGICLTSMDIPAICRHEGAFICMVIQVPHEGLTVCVVFMVCIAAVRIKHVAPAFNLAWLDQAY